MLLSRVAYGQLCLANHTVSRERKARLRSATFRFASSNDASNISINLLIGFIAFHIAKVGFTE